MAKEFCRYQRIAQEIQKEIAIILHLEIRDPRIKMVTVSEVKVSRDLSYAKVFVTFFNVFNKTQETNLVRNSIKVLNGNLGKHIRYLLAKKMYLRIVPELTFFYDNSFFEGMRISNLLSNVLYD